MSNDQDHKTINTILAMSDEDAARAICQRFKETAAGIDKVHPSTAFNVFAHLAANAIFTMSADTAHRHEYARLMFEYVHDLIDMIAAGYGETLRPPH